MNFRSLTILLSVTMLFAMSASAQRMWTLSDCISYAMEHNLQIQQSQNALRSAEVDVKQSKAALFPSLSFSSQQQLGFQKLESQSYGSFDSKATNPSYSGSYGLQGNVTIYDGGNNWLTVKKNRLTLQTQQLENEKTANDIVIRIIQAYYQVMYAHESVLTNKEIVALSERECERTIARQQAGKGNKVDVAQMESQLQQNRYQLTQAETTEQENILSLKQLLQLAPSGDFSVSFQEYGDNDVLAPVQSLAASEQQALAYLPDMKVADAKVRSAEMQVKMAKTGSMPTVSLNAGVSTSNGNSLGGNFATQIKNHLYGSVGLSLQVPIYDRRSTRSSVEKAQLQLSDTQINQENAQLDLQNTIASLHLDIMSAQSRYRSAVESEKAARLSYEMMNERYGVGLETLIDLLTEKNNYLRAKQETLQSKYMALLNMELLKCYTGQQEYRK